MQRSVEPVLIYLSESHTRTVRTGSYCEIEGMCFWVTLRSPLNGESERAAVVEDAYELNVFLSQAAGVEVAQVQMLCPPSISGRPHWSLEELRKIVIHRGLESSQSAVVYETAVATYRLGDLDLRRRKRSHVLYSARNLKARITTAAPPLKSAEEPQLYAHF